MKNARLQPIVVLTCFFILFVACLFLIRTKPPAAVRIEVLPVASGNGSITAIKERININTATSDQLQQLPGIGSTLAGRVIAYRKENGAFESVGELLLIPGMGQKKLEEIWDLVTTGG